MIFFSFFFSTFCRITLKLKHHARLVDDFLLHHNYFQIFCLLLFTCVKQHQNLQMQAYSCCWVKYKLPHYVICRLEQHHNRINIWILSEDIWLIKQCKISLRFITVEVNLFPLLLMHDSTTPGNNKSINTNEITETVTCRCSLKSYHEKLYKIHWK